MEECLFYTGVIEWCNLSKGKYLVTKGYTKRNPKQESEASYIETTVRYPLTRSLFDSDKSNSAVRFGISKRSFS